MRQHLATILWLTACASRLVADDGTLSPAKTLIGLDYAIGANLGKQAGGNLFQSFGCSDFMLARLPRSLARSRSPATAAHESPHTTKLYYRTGDGIILMRLNAYRYDCDGQQPQKRGTDV
jgi:hypothetical protein